MGRSGEMVGGSDGKPGGTVRGPEGKSGGTVGRSDAESGRTVGEFGLPVSQPGKFGEAVREAGEPVGQPHSPVVPHWFDFVCPFCYVGQQRNRVLVEHGLEVVHLPFQIHPEIPPEGIEAGPRTGPMYAALEREAERAGLTLRWPGRLPNTRTALAASAWARLRQPAASDQLNHALFAAHFAFGEDLGDPAVIERHAKDVGIDVGALRVAWADGSAGVLLGDAEAVGARFGVRATPSWLIGGEPVSGLLPPEEFARRADDVLRRVLG